MNRIIKDSWLIAALLFVISGLAAGAWAQCHGGVSACYGTWDVGASPDTSAVNATLYSGSGQLWFRGTGAMADYEIRGGRTSAPWVGYEKSIIMIVINDVTHIGAYAFAGSVNLKIVRCTESEVPPSVGSNAFFGLDLANVSLFVPVSAINAYRTAPVWKDFGYINPSTVTFLDAAGGNAIDSQKVTYGGKVIRPAAAPTREGYTFDGWYGALNPYGIDTVVVPELWDFDKPVMFPPHYDFALFAEWTSTTSVINRNAPAANRLGIAVNGASLRIVGTSQATPVRIYDMRGKALMTRTVQSNESISVGHLARGTYVVKAAGMSVKLVLSK